MKKHIALLAALVMAVSTLTACGSKSETDNTATSETTITTLSTDAVKNDVSADTKTETVTEETTIETEPEAAVHADIEEASPCYYGGVMFKTAENEFYYYRFSDKKLFDLNEYDIYVDSSVCVSGSIAVLNNKIINVDTNEVLYDLSDDSVSLYKSDMFDGRRFGNTGVLAVKATPKGFDAGDPVIIALKNDGSVIGEVHSKDEFGAVAVNDNYLLIAGRESYICDIATGDKLNIEIGSWDHFPLETDNYIYYIDSNGNGARYDKNSDSSSIMLSVNDYSYMYTHESNAISNHMDIYGYNQSTNKLSVIDTETDSIIDFDLSSFAGKCDSMGYPYMACSDYTAIRCYKSDTDYIALLDAKGNTLFDPVAIGNNEKIYYSENYFVCCDKNNSFVFDTNTKTVTYPNDGLSIESYDTMGSDILLIKDSNGNYFLANAATPNDLYSPFDDYVQ